MIFFISNLIVFGGNGITYFNRNSSWGKNADYDCVLEEEQYKLEWKGILRLKNKVFISLWLFFRFLFLYKSLILVVVNFFLSNKYNLFGYILLCFKVRIRDFLIKSAVSALEITNCKILWNLEFSVTKTLMLVCNRNNK